MKRTWHKTSSADPTVVSPYQEALHLQSPSDDDIELERELGGHGFATPLMQYTELLQAVQSPPLGPANPPLHTHAWRSLDPG